MSADGKLAQLTVAGSQWNKWDLHVHTPASITNHYSGGSKEEIWEQFFTDLEALPSEFKVIGINDYIFVDGYERVLNAKREGRLKNIDLILPVVELRLDKFGGVVRKAEDGSYSRSDLSRVNLHVIFDQLEPDVIRQQFLSALSSKYKLLPESAAIDWQAVITPESLAQLGQLVIGSVPDEEKPHRASPLQEGFNNLNLTFDAVSKALENHTLKGRYVLAVGKAEWENIKWNDQSIAEKKNVINSVSIVFTAAQSPAAYEKSKARLLEQNVNGKLFDCSDAHSYSTSENKDRIGNCFTWIKADCTFLGLRQALLEFQNRVFVGDRPEKLVEIDHNKTKYIKSISIKKSDGATLSDEWFDVTLPLSPDLVAVIGNKGSGKSAFADAIALAGHTKNHRNFSFLTTSRFRNPRSNLASHFYAELLWYGGDATKLPLDQDPNPSAIERVRYIPQSYLEGLCNDLATGGKSDFEDELRHIIFSHLPKEDRLGFTSLDDLLEYKVSEIEKKRQEAVTKLRAINTRIVGVERRLRPEYRLALVAKLENQNDALAVLEAAKPGHKEDTSTAGGEGTFDAVVAKIAELEESLAAINALKEQSIARLGAASKQTARITLAQQAIGSHVARYDEFIVTLQHQLSEIDPNLKATEMIKLSVDTSSLAAVSRVEEGKVVAENELLHGESGLNYQILALEGQVLELKTQLGEQQRQYLLYKEALSNWERQRKAIIGKSDDSESIEGLKAQIAALDQLPGEHDRLSASRIELVRVVHGFLSQFSEEFRKAYGPVQKFVAAAKAQGIELVLDFGVSLSQVDFQDEFLQRINRGVKGTFAGIEESNAQIERALLECDFTEVEATIAFVQKVNDMLHFDRRSSSSGEPVDIETQLRKGVSAEDLHNLIFSLEYVLPSYRLTFEGQDIAQLSPGERGLLLLVFYLLVDNDSIPLIIDQPEENLDNQTIFKVLVKSITAAKKRRQIVMVTHNPNLAVVCDAEQIVYAECNKAGKKFSYEAGAIEAPVTKAHVMAVLEGTKPAFNNRSEKYAF